MSSTTERRNERGQILVLFTLSAFVIFVVAALAFDVGMMLVERRDQQNAADAAALAGARYLLLDEARARAAATDMATKNGFTEGSGSAHVTVYIPPAHGIYKGMTPGFIEVQISATRPSIFGGIVGRAVWPVGAYGVAANQPGLTFSFGMLALNETACKAIHVSGNGLVYSKADIQSNSSGSGCGGDPTDWYGFSRTGGGEIDIDADNGTCRSVGAIQDRGSGNMDSCLKAPYSFPLPDPLRDLPAVPQPELAAAIQPYLHSTDIPAYCPGATNAGQQPSATNPKLCAIGQGSAESSKQWILSPGLYPGGIDIKGDSTIYLLPGIYWIGGGGFSVAGDSDIFSVASADPVDLAVRGAEGVLIYNSKLGTTGASAAGPITLGGSGALVNIQPLGDLATGSPEEIYKDIIIFQDRTVSATVTLNGSDSMAEVGGIVYVPKGEVKLNGSDTSNDLGAKLVVDQIIADTFLIDGKGGRVDVLRERGVDVVISGAGLVE